MKNKKFLAVCSLVIGISILFSSCSGSPALTATPTGFVLPRVTPVSTFVPSSTPIIISPTATVETTYTVLEGDTLWGISQMFGVSVERIAQKNKITDPGQIYPGQVLIIPGAGETLQPLPTVTQTNKWIYVILSQQMVYAYEGDTLVREFVVSTGVQEHPTVTGTYYIYIKLESTRMTGEGYDLPNVPWTMYFYEGYSFHGTYWHNNFGHPMSHGCVNMKTEDAKWLFDWALVGTKVVILP